MADYYQVLGVSKEASPTEIKRAYRKMAIHYHPDRHGGDAAKTQAFQIINEAYQILSDPAKRRIYDGGFLYEVLQQAAAQQASAPTPEQEAAFHKDPAYRRRKQYNPNYQYKEQPYKPPLSRRGLVWYVAAGVVATAFFFLGLFQFMFWHSANSYTEKAIASYQNGNGVAAKTLFYAALNQKDDRPLPHLYLGKFIMYENGNYDMALQHLEKLVGLEGATADYFYFLGEAYRLANRYERAKLAYLQAIELESDFYPAYMKLGDISMYKNLAFRKAIGYYTKVLASPKSEVEALVEIGVAHYKLREYEESDRFFMQAESMSQAQPVVTFYQGLKAMEVENDTAQACYFWGSAAKSGVEEAEIMRRKHCY